MTYPKRFKWHNADLTVDFDSIGSGTVVVAGHGNDLGAYKTSWVEHDSPQWVEVIPPSKRSTIHKQIGAYRGRV